MDLPVFDIGYRCIVCGTPIEKPPGKGRPPSFCDSICSDYKKSVETLRKTLPTVEERIKAVRSSEAEAEKPKRKNSQS